MRVDFLLRVVLVILEAREFLSEREECQAAFVPRLVDLLLHQPAGHIFVEPARYAFLRLYVEQRELLNQSMVVYPVVDFAVEHFAPHCRPPIACLWYRCKMREPSENHEVGDVKFLFRVRVVEFYQLRLGEVVYRVFHGLFPPSIPNRSVAAVA